MFDIIIIGKGPAGISASLYTSRANIKTLVIGSASSLSKSHLIDNYYGFKEGISGIELLKQGEAQTVRFGTHILEDEVIALEYDFEGTFTVKTKSDSYKASTVLLATGSGKKRVSIKNIEKFTGKGVHYCTTCDGYFYRNKKVAILGFNEYALNESEEMKHFTKDLVLLTNGNQETPGFEGMDINRKKIVSVEGDDYLEKVVYEDGSEEEFDGIFAAYGTASSADFARKLGIILNGDIIEVDGDQKTNMNGLFAAGDCTSNIKQIAVAAGQGAVAGLKITEYIRNLRR
jgi:thioredoxin reductase (NADPH)